MFNAVVTKYGCLLSAPYNWDLSSLEPTSGFPPQKSFVYKASRGFVPEYTVHPQKRLASLHGPGFSRLTPTRPGAYRTALMEVNQNFFISCQILPTPTIQGIFFSLFPNAALRPAMSSPN